MKPLTRETRDTLFLVGVVALCVLPHLLRLPLWAGLTLALLLGWRARLTWTGQPLPGRWLLGAILAASCVATKLSHGVLIGRASGLTLVCVLMALKLLEMHDRRDAFVVFFLGFFLVLTQFLHSQSLWVAFWTVATVWGLLTSLVLAQMPLGQPHLRLAAREAARTTLYGLPVMVGLFLLFPRIAPLWGVPAGLGSTGLSDQMEFGNVAELASDDRIAMRLRALPGSRLPTHESIYLRGPVLTRFDGLTWRAAPIAAASWAPGPGEPLHYEAVLEPQRLTVLPVLESSPGQPGERWVLPGLMMRRENDLNWVADRPITERLQFEQQAWIQGAPAGPLEEHPSLQAARRLPAGLNPRLHAWVRELARDRDANALVEALLAHIRQQPYVYTLTPGIYGETSPHAIDEFWFDRRQGFCEHYAAATVVALRAAGVPARIVTGYQGMDPEPVEGWQIVRNSNAHAWVEYWQAGHGWLRADPTAAVAPERVRLGRRLAPAPGALQGALNAFDPTLWLRLRSFAEGLDLRWQQWVLGYAREQQFSLLRELGLDADWNSLGQVVAACITSLAIGAWGWMRWQQRESDPWVRLQRRAGQALRQAGLAALPHQSPLRWAELARGGALRASLLELEALRYGADRPPPGWGPRRAWWRAFRKALSGDTAGRPQPSST